MTEFFSLIGIGLALLIGAASPGPSFVLVARTAVGNGRRAGIASALGMGVGGLGFAVACLLGLHGLLLAVPNLYSALKLAGGAYLLYLGLIIWRGARQPLELSFDQPASEAPSLRDQFTLALLLQLSNPKTALVYASVFTAIMPDGPSLSYKIAVAILTFSVEAGWYLAVAFLLSASAPRAVYLRSKRIIDRVVGALLGALGIKLASSQALS